MKIALLTIWHVGNYGAEMQTYATVKALNSLGHEVKVIDYRLNEPQRIIDKLISKVLFITPAYQKFRRFWKSNIPALSHLKNSTDLKDKLGDFDAYMVGSDQVWNPNITKDKCFDFFLSFVPENKYCVSYASSFGISSWKFDKELTERVSVELSKFQKISCRERDGVNILKDVFDINATFVCDPTLLFEGYPELIGNIQENNSFVYYPLSVDKEMESFCKEVATSLHLEFIHNNPQTTWMNGRVWNRLSIDSWIRNFAQAKFVTTQSFHGTAFSIIYKKQFFTIYQGSKVSRISNLLKELGIEDRLFPSVEAARSAKPWLKPINYEEVNERLMKLRKKSWDFLESI